jgi:hypothetical protein
LSSTNPRRYPRAEPGAEATGTSQCEDWQRAYGRVRGLWAPHAVGTPEDGRRAAPEEIAGWARGSVKRKTPQLIEAIEGQSHARSCAILDPRLSASPGLLRRGSGGTRHRNPPARAVHPRETSSRPGSIVFFTRAPAGEPNWTRWCNRHGWGQFDPDAVRFRTHSSTSGHPVRLPFWIHRVPPLCSAVYCRLLTVGELPACLASECSWCACQNW